MSYIDSLHEKGTGLQDPLRAAGHQRAPAPFPQNASGLRRQMARALVVCMLVAGTRLKQLGRRSQAQHVAARPLSSLGSPHH